MLGPVMICMRVLAFMRVWLAMKLPLEVSAMRASTTGWRPASISMQGWFTNSGAHQFSVSERSASVHSTSMAAMAPATRVSAGTWGCSWSSSCS